METLELPIGEQVGSQESESVPAPEPAWLTKPLTCRYCNTTLTRDNARVVDIEAQNRVCKACRVAIIDPEMAAVRRRLAPVMESFKIENVRAIAEARVRGLIRLPVDLKDVGMEPAAPKCNLPDPGAEIEAHAAKYRHRKKGGKSKPVQEPQSVSKSEDDDPDSGPANAF